jgi:hypothetical protein
VYAWLVALHVGGFVVFLACHAVSMWTSFQVRAERDRAVIGTLLALSVRSSRVMYLGLLLMGAAGLGAAASAGLLLAPWVVASYVVLAVVFVVMSAIAGSYYHPLRAALQGTDSAPPLDDEALAARLRTRRPELLLAVGGTGLVVLVLLMSVRPMLW